MIGLTVAHFEIYRKTFEASFTLKRSSSRAILETPRPLSLKTTRRPTRTPQKIRKELGRAYIEMLQDAFDEGV